ncbi:STAS domain-containing protein [Streptomyces sp. NPDC005385]|uniref:STAS domain-containing protein n=1 Tax=Streptomyces sp. NPDC005385 TaxID=3157039 RepID=UPI0033B09C8A
MSDRAAGPARLDISSRIVDAVTVVTVRGEIDDATRGQFHDAMNSAHGEPPRIVVDLSAVPFMDSSGLSALIATHNSVRGAGGWIRLVAPTEPVRYVMHVISLDTLITSYPTLSLALSA